MFQLELLFRREGKKIRCEINKPDSLMVITERTACGFDLLSKSKHFINLQNSLIHTLCLTATLNLMFICSNSTKPLDVVAIDNLPSLLPRESSVQFAESITPYLLKLPEVLIILKLKMLICWLALIF